MRLIAFLITLLPSILWSQPEMLTIEFRDLESTDGYLMFRVKDAQGEKVLEKKVKIQSLEQDVELELAPGSYAVAVYHDENSNQKLDRAFTGVPTEEYGFSNDARALMSAPDLQEQIFKHQKNTVIRIHLK